MTPKILVKTILISFFIFLFGINTYAAEKGHAVTSISFGGYQTTDGKDTLTGSQLALSYLNYFSKQWAYFIRLSNGSATGEHTDKNVTRDLSASSTTLTGGVQWSYDIDLNSDNTEDLTPYVGTGLSIQKYDYDFEYNGSEVGKTSGTGYGPFVTLGLKISISSNIVLIPSYHFEQITITTEDGSNHSFTSSGISLAFVARF